MFKDFKQAVLAQFEDMKEMRLFRTDVSKEQLWDTYLESFPEGTNPMFRERTEHDCQHCKQFIRAVGNMVGIDSGLVSIWDVSDVGPVYQPVADALSKLVKAAAIRDVFLYAEKKVGVDFNLQELEDGETITWDHFYVELPDQVVTMGVLIGPKLADYRSTKEVFQRGLEEITFSAVETVLELIEQNSLYRGQESKNVVTMFHNHKIGYDRLNDEEKELYVWLMATTDGAASLRIRNTAIGTLLTDLSEGKDLDYAVKSFETKVAPMNYKRPTALITQAMIRKAQETIVELGFESALQRRYANIADITINNILYADRTAKKEMDVFDELAADVTTKVKQTLGKIEQVPVEDFIDNILPKAETVEIMVENRHEANMVSLIAPCDPDSKNMFKWDNNFSWAYSGEYADSVKERVKRAGGDIEGDLRCSLAWHNKDDLDIHLRCPDQVEIYYSSKRPAGTTGRLDVDMNAGGIHDAIAPVENITFKNADKIKEGKYELIVHNYSKRTSEDVGFEVELEFNGKITTFRYPKMVKQGQNISVVTFNYTKAGGVKIVESIGSTEATKQVWGVNTHTFVKVRTVMASPNHWDGFVVGNKHYFFMIEDCIQEGKARGFFNEFLKPELDQHRKVFEVLGSKMKTEESEDQLSGLGFSTTQRNSVFCKITGSFARTIEIVF